MKGASSGVNAAFIAHIAQSTTSLAICTRITRTDGELILQTEHDKSLTVTVGDSSDEIAGVYASKAGVTGSDIHSSSDLSIDNLELEGSTQRELTVWDVRPADIEAGLLDNARVKIFYVNWKAPDEFQFILKVGTLGDITRTHEGRYKTEVRGLTQALATTFVRTYGILCDAELGDERCKVDLSLYTYTGVVTAVTNRKLFTVNITGTFVDERLVKGLITFTSGLNDGFDKEVKAYAAGAMELYEPMPLDVVVGDTFTIQQGCPKTKAACIEWYDNLLNRRAHADFVPGMNEILKVGGQVRGTQRQKL